MATFVRLSNSTLHLLENAAYRLSYLDPRQKIINPSPFYLYDVKDGLVEIDALRAHLIYLNNVVKRYEGNNEITENHIEAEEGLVCEIDLEVIPLYKDAISVSALRYIIEPEKIQFLLQFIGIPKSKNGLDIENHQFGYHFHYGMVKSGKLKRTNVLFSFDPTKTQQEDITKPPLYYEYHGEGHSKHIDVGAIGNNKRKPIYLVCYDEAIKRGIINFKRLKKGAGIFYQ